MQSGVAERDAIIPLGISAGYSLYGSQCNVSVQVRILSPGLKHECDVAEKHNPANGKRIQQYAVMQAHYNLGQGYRDRRLKCIALLNVGKVKPSRSLNNCMGFPECGGRLCVLIFMTGEAAATAEGLN